MKRLNNFYITLLSLFLFNGCKKEKYNEYSLINHNYINKLVWYEKFNVGYSLPDTIYYKKIKFINNKSNLYFNQYNKNNWNRENFNNKITVANRNNKRNLIEKYNFDSIFTISNQIYSLNKNYILLKQFKLSTKELNQPMNITKEYVIFDSKFKILEVVSEKKFKNIISTRWRKNRKD